MNTTAPVSAPPLQLLQLAAQLRPQLERAFDPVGGFGRLSGPLARGSLADSVTTLLVHDANDRPVGVLQCSAPRGEGVADLVQRELERVAAARAALGPRLGEVLLSALAHADDGQRSYAAYPLCHPVPKTRLGNAAARAFLRAPVLAWLRETVRLTSCQPTPAAVERDFAAPLASVAADPRLSASIRAGARGALERLAADRWRPRHVLAHNDLWQGNLLLLPRRIWWRTDPPSRPFVVIDWRGSHVHGHAFVDLLCLAESSRMCASTLSRELAHHAWLVGCDPLDVKGYALASMGLIGQDLGCFEPRRWVLATETMWSALQDVLGH